MIDTHCHLSYAPLYEQLPSVLARAQSAGVRHMITIGTSLRDSLICRDLAGLHPQISAAVGIHPHHAEEATANDITQVVAMFSDTHVLAAGEMGLDFHYEHSPRETQIRLFEGQLGPAIAAGKALVIHSREAIAQTLAILKNAKADRAVFHCFTGTMDEARQILDAGFYLGFTGIVTFKNTENLRDIVRIVPPERLLVETDAPYLSPEPVRRQKDCEPAMIAHVYRRIAQLRGVAQEQLAERVMQNSRKLFGLP